MDVTMRPSECTALKPFLAYHCTERSSTDTFSPFAPNHKDLPVHEAYFPVGYQSCERMSAAHVCIASRRILLFPDTFPLEADRSRVLETRCNLVAFLFR